MKKSKTPKKKKAPVGRPSKYDPKYCDEIIKFFDIAPYQKATETITFKDGSQKTVDKTVANDLPFISQFAKKIGVSRDTINEWSKKHSEFSDALKKAKEMQEAILVTNGLHGLYNPTFAIFTAKNIAGWRDKIEQELYGKNGKPLVPNRLGKLNESDLDAMIEKKLKCLEKLKSTSSCT